jgi:hypothetical protein
MSESNVFPVFISYEDLEKAFAKYRCEYNGKADFYAFQRRAILAGFIIEAPK